MSKIAMLTGGGDCPGLNAVIAGATRTLEDAGLDAVGLVDGWRGAVEGLTMDLSPDSTANIIGVGGTILGSSRTNPYKIDGGVDKIKASFEKLSIDALIAIGGDDTLGVATRLFEEEQMHVIGVPKTIDNDLSATDFTFGFDTAVNIAMDAVDKIRTTARSHHRVLVIETMGRHAGWIAAYTGICGNADVTLVPEMKVDIEAVCCTLKRKREKGQHYNLVVVSEGATFQEGDFLTQDTELDAFGHVRLGGAAETHVAEGVELGVLREEVALLEGRALRDDDQVVMLALFALALEGAADGFDVDLHLGNERDVGVAADAGICGYPARVPAHGLDHKHPVVAARGGAYLVHRVHGDVDGGVETKCEVSRRQVVVDGLRNADHMHLLLFEKARGDAERVVAADGYQRVDGELLEAGLDLVDAAVNLVGVGARRPEDGAADAYDVGGAVGAEIHRKPLDRAAPSVDEADSVQPGVFEGPGGPCDDRVQAGAVSTAGKHGNFAHLVFSLTALFSVPLPRGSVA